MDVFDPQKRSEVMARIKGKDTKPELVVRRYLHAKGLRYRLHDKRWAGCPDLSFPSHRLVVFVNGCFWHGHLSCRKASIPVTRTDFWKGKIEANRARDAVNQLKLENLGLRVITIWECEINESRLKRLFDEIVGNEIDDEPADWDSRKV